MLRLSTTGASLRSFDSKTSVMDQRIAPYTKWADLVQYHIRIVEAPTMKVGWMIFAPRIVEMMNNKF